MKSHKINALDALAELEKARLNHAHDPASSDWSFRVAEAIVAKAAGFTNRNQWTEILNGKEIVK